MVRALKGANIPGLGWVVPDFDAYDVALYPREGREVLTNPDTLRYDHRRRYDGDGPTEWWADARVLLRCMRQAKEQGLPGLMADLEGLRERAKVQ